MDRLILFRHGKAEAASASGDDFDRKLAPRGEAEAAQMARRLEEQGWVPDLALVSTAQRTRETWAAAAPSFPNAQARFEAELYLADTPVIARLAEAAGRAARTVMVVGHNPGLHEYALRLMIEGHAAPDLFALTQRKFPPAAVATFEFVAGKPRAHSLLLPEG
jgi:phosphohistidine phosphatase